ncbi:hypothetical protein [Paracoccus mutanolyticus]|uniref:hypothetical protein n=1 Tax=Paracoccus mutanolyticus TaxID=1499308 RepID=UPI00167B7C08|nr:hypothetical protein [Paracoccus mutanolyticus]
MIISNEPLSAGDSNSSVNPLSGVPMAMVTVAWIPPALFSSTAGVLTDSRFSLPETAACRR